MTGLEMKVFSLVLVSTWGLEVIARRHGLPCLGVGSAIGLFLSALALSEAFEVYIKPREPKFGCDCKQSLVTKLTPITSVYKCNCGKIFIHRTYEKGDEAHYWLELHPVESDMVLRRAWKAKFLRPWREISVVDYESDQVISIMLQLERMFCQSIK